MKEDKAEKQENWLKVNALVMAIATHRFQDNDIEIIKDHFAHCGFCQTETACDLLRELFDQINAKYRID